jgi:hypothetical protein
MKRRGHISPFICLLIVTFALTAATEVCAQDFMQPPFAPMPRVAMPSLMGGRFYIQAGAQYRSLQSLQFNAFGGPETLTAVAGTVPFGPTTAGDFGVGTGKEGFIGTNGPPLNPNRWPYDNGFLSGPVSPAGVHVSCAGPPVTDCSPADEVWTPANTTSPTELGRIVFLSGAGDCCAGTTAPGHIGSFGIYDATVQVDNPGSIVGTTKVTFQLQDPNSFIYTLNAMPDINREIGPKVWSPVITLGFQAGDFFDVFSGFSWFNVNNAMGYSVVVQGTGGRSLIQDTFPFVSDQDVAWPVGLFQSADTIIGSEPTHRYVITPNSPLRGIYPNRQFLTQTDNAIALENIRQTVNSTADISVYESRYGGRSWVPLYGMGSLGVYTGFSFMAAYYKLTENRVYISEGPRFPGVTLLAISAYHTDWRPHYGGFVGSDLALAFGPVYVNGSIDYTWASEQSYRLDVVETNFRPGGLTAGVAGGIRF